MKKNKTKYILCSFLLCFFVACGYQALPSIQNNMSYPGSIVALSSNQFVVLNTDANGDYNDGSIQLYTVDTHGNQSLTNSLSVPQHGTELAVTPDSKYVAMSYDASVSPSVINFYNYSKPSSPQKINLVLNLANVGGQQQAVKRLGFFQRTSDTNYYLYGVIYSNPQSGSNDNIPLRTFLAKINSNFTSASVLFYLSYGVGDPNSLSAKSNSITSNSYAFGFSAPTYDAVHDLFLAFPTGSIAGTSTGLYPPLPPSTYLYYEGQYDPNKGCNPSLASCTTTLTQNAPDLRVTSLVAVDLAHLNGVGSTDPLNNSTYFVPLAWNNNGVPYGANTGSYTINYQNYTPHDGVVDLSSLSFQTGFWASQWVSYTNAGASNSSCYSVNVNTTSANEYNLNTMGQNALLVGKVGNNGGSDTGFGNEVFQIGGLDILKSSITTIQALRGVNTSGETDFSAIAQTQVLDVYNTYYAAHFTASWLNPIPYNSGNLVATNTILPVVPYMFSRTTGVSGFNGTLSAPVNIGVLNFGTQSKCTPYWIRDTVTSLQNWGQDSSWLGASVVASSTGVYPQAVINPTQPSSYSLTNGGGAEMCTDVSPTSGSPLVFCVNFMHGNMSHFRTSNTGSVFSQY